MDRLYSAGFLCRSLGLAERSADDLKALCRESVRELLTGVCHTPLLSLSEVPNRGAQLL